MPVYRLIAVVIFLAGLFNLWSGFWSHVPSRLVLIEQIVPLSLIHLSRTLTVIAGFFMLFLAKGLWQRKKRSWWLSLIIVGASVILHLIKGLDFEESLIGLVIFGLLINFKGTFTVKSAGGSILQGFKNSLLILLILFVYSLFGFFAIRREFTHQVTIANLIGDYVYSVFGIGQDALIPTTKHARWFEDSLTSGGLISLGLVFAALFAPLVEKKKPTRLDKALARRLILGSGINSTSYLSLQPETNLFINQDRTGLIAYRIANNVAVALGDPIGSGCLDTLKSFIAQHENNGLTVCFYNTAASGRKLYNQLKLKSIKIGDEAVVITKNFSLKTPAAKDIRYNLNKMKRLLIKFRWYPLNQVSRKTLKEIDGLYNQWLKTKKFAPLGFSLNYYPFPSEACAQALTVYSSENKLIGAFSFLPYKKQKGMVLESMLRSHDAPNGMSEGALAEAILHFKEGGYDEVSLGVAPLSGTTKAIKFVFDHFNRFYNYRSLFAFKAKFNPAWRSKYLTFKKSGDLPKITLALIQVHLR